MTIIFNSLPFSGKNTRFRFLEHACAGWQYLRGISTSRNSGQKHATQKKFDINKENAVWEAPAMFLTKTFN